MSEQLAKFIRDFDPRHADAMASVLKFALEHIPGDFVQYDRFDFQGGAPRRVAHHCHPSGLGETGDLPGAICKGEFVTAGRPSATIADILQSPYAGSGSGRPDSLRSYIGCPVDPAGALAVCSRHRQAFSGQHTVLLTSLARLILMIQQQQDQTPAGALSACEDKLDESKALYEQMLHLSPVAIYRLDLIRQRFIKVNAYMCKATGYTEEEFLKMNPADLLTPKSRELFLWRCQAMASGHPVSKDVEFEIVTKSGAVEWGRFHIRHLHEDGQLTGANVVAHFITEEKAAYEALAKYRQQLEESVADQTAELARSNQQLRQEIEQRTVATDELRSSSERLKEMNTAMRVLLDKRKEEQQRAEELIRLNLKELIDPFLERLGQSGLRNNQKQLLDVIRMNLDEVVGSSMPEFSSKCYLFSPNELHVVNLIRKGKTTKEMAALLNLSVRTIESYRNSIRSKLKLKNKKINLKTYLTSI